MKEVVSDAATGAGTARRAAAAARHALARPRLGFLGLGWIGRARLAALLRAGACEAVALADPDEAALAAAGELAPGARALAGLEELLACELDGVVIATPSASHAAQTLRALDAGLAVFCQKPLGRTAAEVAAVLDLAQAKDLLVGIDLCYRRLAGMDELRHAVRAGELGRVHAFELVFHNAYGPDKPWFHDAQLSGGGCVMDLGVHLVDLALWLLGDAEVERVDPVLFARGERLRPGGIELELGAVEDHAEVRLELRGGRTVGRLACSWSLHAGRDAVIEVLLHGDRGGASVRNVGGSFYDFQVELLRGTSARVLAAPPDEWGGRAASAWARRLARGERAFDAAEAERVLRVARVLDGIYGR